MFEHAAAAQGQSRHDLVRAVSAARAWRECRCRAWRRAAASGGGTGQPAGPILAGTPALSGAAFAARFSRRPRSWLHTGERTGPCAGRRPAGALPFFRARRAGRSRAAVRLWRLAAAARRASRPRCFAWACACMPAKARRPITAEAVSWFRAAARKQVAEAMFLLGQCTTFGFGVTPDPEVGSGLVSARGGARQPRGRVRTGRSPCGRRGHLPRDLDEAVKWWRQRPRRGMRGRNSSSAIVTAGARAWKRTRVWRWPGTGARRKVAKPRRTSGSANAVSMARAWRPIRWRRGALSGCRRSRRSARPGRIGPLPAVRHRRADRYGTWRGRHCKQAAENGWQPALGRTRTLLVRRRRTAFPWSRRGHDAARARLCYRKAGELGHRRAAYMLAECLRHGHGR